MNVTRAGGGTVDAHGSGPCVRKDVRVQIPPRPRNEDDPGRKLCLLPGSFRFPLGGRPPKPPGVPLGLRPSCFAARPLLSWSFGSPVGVERCLLSLCRGGALCSPRGLSWSFGSPVRVERCLLSSCRGGCALGASLRTLEATPWRVGEWTWGGSCGDFGLVLIRMRRDQRSWIVRFWATRPAGPEAVNPPSAVVPTGEGQPGGAFAHQVVVPVAVQVCQFDRRALEVDPDPALLLRGEQAGDDARDRAVGEVDPGDGRGS